MREILSSLRFLLGGGFQSVPCSLVGCKFCFCNTLQLFAGIVSVYNRRYTRGFVSSVFVAVASEASNSRCRAPVFFVVPFAVSEAGHQ